MDSRGKKYKTTLSSESYGLTGETFIKPKLQGQGWAWTGLCICFFFFGTIFGTEVGREKSRQ
jgi:hypothetical protein